MSNNKPELSNVHRDSGATVEPLAADKAPVTDDATSASTVTRKLLCLCLGLLMLLLIADRIIPSTDMARVRGNVIPITPLVSGPVVEVNVHPNDRVEQGAPLVRIDPTDYQIAVKQAEQGLEQAGKQVGIHTASVQAAQVALTDALINQDNIDRQARRVLAMAEQGIVTLADADKTRAAIAHANARVQTARSGLEQARKQLGKRGQQNSEIQSALLQLQQAQLDLSRTVLRAPAMGGVSNFRLDAGVYANKGQPLMTFVSGEDSWVEAYFRENSLGNIRANDSVEIALDNAPGRVFRGRVASIDYGVNWQGAQPSGQLATVDNQSGWLRQSQRFPVMIRFDQPLPPGLLRVGGQADVMVYTDDDSLMNVWGQFWIRLLSWLSYAR
ncbi:HlyD family secretion protein [Ferrimonas sp. SCSIO 43195]|uniref:HlyD family secretion protein n=1 Tax=Ferrimonas sp. SCSIO 43195 TaxID=2822844 RepID=UPI0020763EE4|nr:HlyD family secretion protein [Ferrimonas sp. SCSIO 43195]USD39602.1 HlyD family secretion protein [Ferrimonas sp. SCSIO 43195]